MSKFGMIQIYLIKEDPGIKILVRLKNNSNEKN